MIVKLFNLIYFILLFGNKRLLILYVNEKEKGKDEFYIFCEISELKYY